MNIFCLYIVFNVRNISKAIVLFSSKQKYFGQNVLL